MPPLTHVATITGTPHSDYITALAIHWIDGAAHLFTGSAATGGLASYAIAPGGPTYAHQVGPGLNRGTAGVSDIDLITIDGQPILIPSGRAAPRLAFHRIDQDGRFDGVTILGADSALIGNIQSSVVMQVQGKTFLVSSQWGQPGFQAFRIRDDLSLEHKKTWGDTALTYAGDITDMVTAEVAGRSYVFVTSGQDAGVSSYWMGQWGNMKHRDSVGVADGLWVSAPSALTAAEVGGTVYLVLGAAGSNSLTVIRVNSWGGLFIEGHYLDTLDTRFGAVQALDSFTIGDRSFVVAGGGDHGVTLFKLLPGGMLLHVATIEDQVDTTLMNVMAIRTEVIDGIAHIFVSGSDPGFTHFTYDPGDTGPVIIGNDLANTLTGTAGDDIIWGRDGNDTIHGGPGDDILIDGSGADTLFGGAGADVFVFVQDNRMDTIGDFEPGIDRIHLGDFEMLHHFDQLQFTQRDYGVLLTIGNDRIRIMSEQGQLNVLDLSVDDFIFDF